MSNRDGKKTGISMGRRALAATLIALAVSSLATHAQAGSVRDVPGTTVHRPSSTHTFIITQAELDRAAYVVSMLNLPLCHDGRKLTSLLQKRGARLFEVLKSNTVRYLYYVEIRKATNRLLAVYAYGLGWKLPAGVRSAFCVPAAPAQVMDSYRPHDVVRLARFTSTLPA